MNKNIDNYKKAIEQIHVDNELKEKVLERTKRKVNKTVYYLKYCMSFAVVLIVAVVSISLLKTPKEKVLTKEENIEISEENKEELLAKADIKRFQSVEELRETLKEYQQENVYYSEMNSEEAIQEESALSEAISDVTNSTSKGEVTGAEDKLSYSKTNNQVENVDEADIVKTDGKYIYYSQNRKIYILDNDLNCKSTIQSEDFSPYQMFVNSDKLVVFGNFFNVQNVVSKKTSEDVERENIDTIYRPKTEARVYDITDREKPELEREISIDGNYQDARMIGKNVYFISGYSLYFTRGIEELKDEDILPSYKDSYVSEETRVIGANDIAYFDVASSNNYSIIAGFNLESDEDVNIETFLGGGRNIYVSENNMYVVNTNYGIDFQEANSKIYKFQLKNSNILAMGSCEVDGYVNNQFSIDEYNGNLRIATTISKYDMEEEHTTNKITIFNENLEQIGSIDNLVENEDIHSVRFMGDIGYVVTFREIDPLWVIDLSNPTAPVVKGELEIPGYSSYLHPWDETHVIGIGYNVRDNGYGGVANDTIKVSMFDVSDLENPKELFNISFDNKYAYSNIMYDHKALFINKDKNLIGFPVNWYSKVNKTGLILYRVDLENNKFDEISNLTSKGYGFVQRAIYINDYIYNLFSNRIVKYDINSFEEVKRIELGDI